MDKEKKRKRNLVLNGIAIPISVFALYTLLSEKRSKSIPVCQLQVTLKELAHSRCWLFQKFHSNKLHDNLSKNKLHIMEK